MVRRAHGLSRRGFWVAVVLLAGAWVAARELGAGLDVAGLDLPVVVDAAASLGFILLSLARGRAVGMAWAHVAVLLVWLVVSVTVFVAAAMLIASRAAMESEWGELTAVGGLLVSGASWILATMTWLARMDTPDDFAGRQHAHATFEATVRQPREQVGTSEAPALSGDADGR